MLTEQMRVLDPIWNDILNRLRTGDCTAADLEEIKKLLIEAQTTDFSKPPWSEAILITPRNSVRNRWNEAAIKKHCAATNQHRYVIKAEDSLRGSTEELPLIGQKIWIWMRTQL